MKIKSELYLQELALLLHGLDLHLRECEKTMRNEKRRAQIASFLAPWEKSRIWGTLALKSGIILRHVQSVSELREKIMSSEGVDDDMRPITLQQIFEKQAKD